MEELKSKSFDPDISIEKKVEQEKQHKKVGQLKPHKGHTVFQYNTETGAITKAVFEELVLFNSLTKVNKRINVEKDCLYVSALNLKNAAKKIAKYHGINLKIK